MDGSNTFPPSWFCTHSSSQIAVFFLVSTEMVNCSDFCQTLICRFRFILVQVESIITIFGSASIVTVKRANGWFKAGSTRVQLHCVVNWYARSLYVNGIGCSQCCIAERKGAMDGVYWFQSIATVYSDECINYFSLNDFNGANIQSFTHTSKAAN